MLAKLISGVLSRPAARPSPAAPPAAPALPLQAAPGAALGAAPVDAMPGAGVVNAEPSPQAHGSAHEAIEARLSDDRYLRRRQLELTGRGAYFAAMHWMEQLLARPELADPKRLERFGGKTYSQNDEDGILAEIFRRIGAPHRTFVEFGCGDGMENNTVCLLAQGWRGLWMDGGDDNAGRITGAYRPLISAGILQFRQAMIHRDNIDSLIASAGLGPEIDLLSIDLDGNDYYLWEAIACVSPRVVVAEYNGKFLPNHDWGTIYDADYMWDGTDLMGCSLARLNGLARRKGYQLVGCNLSGSNAFFVRDDLASDRFAVPATPEHLFQPARYALTSCFDVGHPTSTTTVLQGACAAAGLPWPPVEPVSSFQNIQLP